MTSTVAGHGMGRIPSKPHPRMALFGVSAALEPTAQPRSYTWGCSLFLDQGSTSQCVGYSSAHDVAARPVVRPAHTALAESFYRYAQDHDYWPGTNYEGTSVDGGMQALREFGYIRSWWWGNSLEETLIALGRGPGIMGIPWYSGMWNPDREGWLHVEGRDEGGHAILAPQVRIRFRPGTTAQDRRSLAWAQYLDLDQSWVGVHNSWGAEWQPRVNGRPVPARLRIPEFARLIREGEIAFPSQRVPQPRG